MRSTVWPILNLCMESVIASTPSASGSSRLFAQAKELKALAVDRRFDHFAREIVWRSLVRGDGADDVPGLELARQLRAGQIAAEGAQLGVGVGLEDENSHRPASMCRTVIAILEAVGSHGSPPAELVALRRAAQRSGALVLVPEDQSPLFQVIGRDFDSDPVAGQGLDAVLFHPSGRVGDELMAVVELNAETRIGQDFGDQALEFQKFFFRHVMILSTGRSNAPRVVRDRAAARRCA